jgi:hypothetical protein
MLIAEGARVVVVVAAEVMAYASLGRHGDLVSYVRGHTVFPMDYHVPFWFLAVVLWVCNIRVEVSSSTFSLPPPQLDIALPEISLQLQCLDYEPEDKTLCDSEAEQFAAALARLEPLRILVSPPSGVRVLSDEAVVAVSGGLACAADAAAAPSAYAPMTPAALPNAAAPASSIFTRTRSKVHKVQSAAGSATESGGADVARRL